MELDVVSRKDNPLLGRIEIQFKISHPKDRTPNRNDVREELANVINSKKDRVVVDSMQTIFGKSETVGYAKVYESAKLAKKIERDHILVRNKLEEKKGKKDKGKEKEKEKEAAKESE
jgi:small subunit ribosomal protein S24e